MKSFVASLLAMSAVQALEYLSLAEMKYLSLAERKHLKSDFAPISMEVDGKQ